MNLLLNQNFTLSFDLKVDDWSKWDIPSPVILEYYNANNARIYYHDTYLSDSFVKIKGDKKNGEWVKVVLTKKGDLSNMKICVDNVTLNDVKFFGARFALFKNGSIHIRKPKLEIGTISTDWTPAPEDQEQNVNDKIAASEKTTEESYKALINQTAKDITAIVQNVQKETSANSTSISEMSTNFKVTADGLSATKSAVKTLTDAVNGTVSKEEMQKYIRWNGDNLELGNSAQPFKCKLSNTELAFYQNTDKVAWITNKELYILKAIIAQSIGCGNFLFVDEGDLGFSLI